MSTLASVTSGTWIPPVIGGLFALGIGLIPSVRGYFKDKDASVVQHESNLDAKTIALIDEQRKDHNLLFERTEAQLERTLQRMAGLEERLDTAYLKIADLEKAITTAEATIERQDRLIESLRKGEVT